jgi:hypothetical protein
MPINLNTKVFQLILEGNVSNTELGLSEVEVLSPTI